MTDWKLIAAMDMSPNSLVRDSLAEGYRISKEREFERFTTPIIAPLLERIAALEKELAELKKARGT